VRESNLDRIEQLQITEETYKSRYLAEKQKNFKLTEKMNKLEHEVRVFKSIRTLEELVEYLNKNGYAPNLVNDDNGKWYLAFDGTQDLGTVTFVTAFTDIPELWCESAPLAICRAALLAVMGAE